MTTFYPKTNADFFSGLAHYFDGVQLTNGSEGADYTDQQIGSHNTGTAHYISNWNVSDITDMNSAFYDRTLFDEDISAWDVSSVENMEYMFYGCANFNQNIGAWDVSSVTTMETMFVSCRNFNQNIRIWTLKISVNLFYMFFNATDMKTTYGGYSGYDNGNPTREFWNIFTANDENIHNAITYYFDETGNIPSPIPNIGQFSNTNKINISKWDVSNVTNMSGIFSNMATFNEDITGWDVSKVDNMTNMFNGATNFSQNISNWRPTSGCDFTNMLVGTSMDKYTYIDGYADLI